MHRWCTGVPILSPGGTDVRPYVACGHMGHCAMLHLCNLRVKYGFCKHQRRDAAPLCLGGPGPRMANLSVSYRCDRYDVVKLMHPKPLVMPREADPDIQCVLPKAHIRLTRAVLALLNDGPVGRRWGSALDTSNSTMEALWRTNDIPDPNEITLTVGNPFAIPHT